jgi:hypothetical protein
MSSKHMSWATAVVISSCVVFLVGRANDKRVVRQGSSLMNLVIFISQTAHFGMRQ